MDFSSDANADSEGLLEVNRGICMPQMAEKTEPDVPPNCAVLPLYNFLIEADGELCAALSAVLRLNGAVLAGDDFARIRQ